MPGQGPCVPTYRISVPGIVVSRVLAASHAPAFSPPQRNRHMTYIYRTLFISAASAALLASTASAQMQGHDGHMMDKAGHDRASHMVEAVATVTKIMPSEGRISLSHGAIPEVSWPAATMKFPIGDKISTSDLAPGDRVQFTLHRAENGALPLVELCKTDRADVQPGLCAGNNMHASMSGHQMDMADGQMDHSKMDHSKMAGHQMDHSNMEHGEMMQGGMDHSKMDHANMDHGAKGQSQMQSESPASDSVSATGTILKIDAEARSLRIKHDPIPAINWPVMTMEFEASDTVSLSGLTKGSMITFDFDPNGEDGYVISTIRPGQPDMKMQPAPAHDHDGH